MFPEAFKYSVAKSVNSAIKWLLNTHGSAFDSFSSGILSLLLWVQGILVSIPWWAYIAFIALMAWIATRKIIPVIVLAVLPIFIGMFGLWHLALETLALVITSVVIALAIGIPMGVLMAEARYFAEFIKPVLDAMQTMPSFVYLIPAMMLFGLGKVPAVIATLIYALPPVMRLTCLGLQQVPRPVQEAALAYGATRWQLLKEVRIPLAMPSILAGVNQTTMMALAMVVIASMIGARGLGQEVLMAINRIDVGRGFEAGISIVIMGIVIDRITQGLAKRWDPNRK
ncbi:MAG: proline/glycine betaine ABC transporter permease [Thermovirgaceae bacterium]|jgi:glycine betaine/proline transport system permease protein|nr:proline/glycine betaine ABC transporter permease [Synergistales bacterium]MDI9392413.1 proline/glycine betaine ABC transporter permease [Synergistota bacterium]NLV65277.1 proline/glycine betaine ABC transporter permease [Synergistaceae bacterium]HRW87198.1 proline/glycine betaine ABC transporter permease [Thermovirgaceae bacterium]MDD3134615.1 proline/glycine betaine ABC transporter permease [Synergistales bacterium]